MQHQVGAQYSAVEWTRTKVALRNAVSPRPQRQVCDVQCQLFAR